MQKACKDMRCGMLAVLENSELIEKELTEYLDDNKMTFNNNIDAISGDRLLGQNEGK